MLAQLVFGDHFIVTDSSGRKIAPRRAETKALLVASQCAHMHFKCAGHFLAS